MEKVILDFELKKKLNGLHDCLEVCDEQGKRLGHFLPAALYDRLFYSALAAESPHSAAELQHRHQQSSGRPLEEIWKDLGQA